MIVKGRHHITMKYIVSPGTNLLDSNMCMLDSNQRRLGQSEAKGDIRVHHEKGATQGYFKDFEYHTMSL